MWCHHRRTPKLTFINQAAGAGGRPLAAAGRAAHLLLTLALSLSLRLPKPKPNPNDRSLRQWEALSLGYPAFNEGSIWLREEIAARYASADLGPAPVLPSLPSLLSLATVG